MSIGIISHTKEQDQKDTYFLLYATMISPRTYGYKTLKNYNRFAARLKGALKQGFPIDYMLPGDKGGYPQGMSLLHVAITDGTGEIDKIIDELLKRGADPDLQTKTGANAGSNALILAAKYAHRKELFEKLISLTKDINLQNMHGDTAFSAICDCLIYENDSASYELLRMLLDAGADPYLNKEWTWERMSIKNGQSIQKRIQKYIAMYYEQKANLKHNKQAEFEYAI